MNNETINNRIKRIRKDIGLTQKDFGEKIGMKANSISDIEKEKNSVTEYVIKLICSGFNVNENWLRTGEGGDENMFLRPQKNDLVSKAAILLGKKDPIFEAFVDTYSKLNDSNREVLLRFGIDFMNSLNSFSEDKAD